MRFGVGRGPRRCTEPHVLVADPDFTRTGSPHVHDSEGRLIWLVSDADIRAYTDKVNGDAYWRGWDDRGKGEHQP